MKLFSIAKLFVFGVVLAGPSLSGLSAEPRANPGALDLARQLNQAFIDVADRVSPSVVVVRIAHKANYNEQEDEENPFFDLLPPEYRRRMQEQREKQRKEQEEEERKSPGEPRFDGQGSGIVIRKEGYILTNRHVVEDAEKIEVRFRDGGVFQGEVRGYDAKSDVAVIKIDPKGKNLVVARLADSDKTRVGEFAIAIGAPFELDYSVTFGHVSAKGRSQILQDPTADQDFIQTDANINPGNSGGPLVNIDGEVIGINTLIRGMRTGIGFAIPINLAREVADKLITDGKFVRAYLGVQIKSLREATEFRERITGVEDGVLISAIPHDGPAAKSELKAGDVITSVDGHPVATSQQLKNEIRGKKIGSTVVLDVFRKGKNLKIKVNPEAWPDDGMRVAGKRNTEVPEENDQPFGLTLQAVTKDLAEQHGLDKVEGVLVTGVARGSVAERRGIKAGDVITEVGGKEVSSPKQFQQALKAADPKKGVVIILTSRGTSKVEILKDPGE